MHAHVRETVRIIATRSSHAISSAPTNTHAAMIMSNKRLAFERGVDMTTSPVTNTAHIPIQASHADGTLPRDCSSLV